ncbi:MAG: filamentous hemagglutinin N-terminal domain-containing protein, partial [Sulfuritalea sp.]|nr:filamentous hemagglutinin N-terminal domain-containing protein [Sulfuritalea sp.]
MFKHATMNRAYRLVWSELHRTWVAVAEFARTRGKRASAVVAASATLALGAGAALAAGDPSPTALPTGGQVIAGQVGISSSGLRMDVTQSSDSAIVNWDSFNIGSQAHVNFAQPSASAVILNRILGGDPSAIFGRMTANGQVFLTNPSGVLFAPGAQVDVGGLVASSLGISDANFLTGKFQFDKVGAGGTVINQGTINAANGGFVALIAPQVSNSGAITAPGGSIGLAAGDSVNLDFDHDGMLSFQVNLPAAAARADNSGVLIADGGRVVMNAQAKDALLSTVLNNEGVIRARSLESRNGEIWLGGGNSGVVSVTGTLDASGTTAGQHGGTVKVLGDKVGLFGQAKIDVSGVGAGGTALVGGNFQGKGPEQNASMTYVGKDVMIDADAVGMGNGGKVIVWADDIARYYGNISARGGAQGGDGGFAEVSGKENLVFRGTVDLTAPNGKGGHLLLDPRDLIIDGGATNAGSGVTTDDAIVGNTVAFGVNTGADTTITEGALEAIGAGATIDLQAENSITLGATPFTAGLTLTNNTNVTFISRNNTGDDGGSAKPAGINLAGVAITASGTGDLTFNTSDDGTGAGNGGTGAYTPTIQLGTLVLGSGTLSVNTTVGTGTIQGAITLNGDVTTAGGIVAFTGPVLLGASLTVDTTNAGGTPAGANITFSYAVNGAKDLTLDAGAGATNFNAAVGSVTPLGDGVGAALSINSTGATSFNDTLATASGLT